MDQVREQAGGDSLRLWFHGVGVEIFCDHPQARYEIGRFFSSCQAGAEESGFVPNLTVELKEGKVIYPVPLHAKRILRYGKLRSYYLEGWTYFTDYFSTLIIDPEGKSLRGNLSPDTIKDFGLSFFEGLLFQLALLEALRFHGLYYLHAAAVKGPDGTGYLISGNAGSGKTSLTLSLILAGFKFLSDDTVFLRLGPGSAVEACGLARDFHVPADLVESVPLFKRFSGLADYGPDARKKRLSVEEWFTGQRIPVLTNPPVLLFPRLQENGEPITALTKSEALAELLPQSLSVMFNPALARPHLEALRRVLNHGRGFRLRPGEDVKGNPAAARRLVETARDLARSKE